VYGEIITYAPEVTEGYHSNPSGGYATKVHFVEHFLERLAMRDDWPPDVRMWQEQTVRWLPEDFYDWWASELRQAKLDNITSARVRTEAVGMVRASYDSLTIGAVALFPVAMGDRQHGSSLSSSADRVVFNEIRGLVVAEEWRGKKEHRVGSQLVERVVEMGRQSKDLRRDPMATVAVTTNYAAARTFEAAGGSMEPGSIGIPLTRLAAGSLMCWNSMDGCGITSVDGCEACPARHDTLWMWPALAEET
jgi:hypothetical protein